MGFLWGEHDKRRENSLKEINTENVIVRRGCRKYIQASDLVWNKGFEQRVAELYDKWLSNGVYEFTESSNPVDTGRKLKVHKTFRRRPGCLLNVLCTFSLRPVSTGNMKQVTQRLVLD